MPKLKTLLKQPLSMPKGIEAKLPAGMPSISGILSSIADALPEGPELPIGGQGGSSPEFKLPRVTTFVKGFEERLPEGLPKVSSLTASLEGPVGKVEEMLGGREAAATPAPEGIVPLVYE